MSKNYQKIDEAGKKNPFKVPEGYFEMLNNRIMEQLDDVTVEQPPVVSLWNRVKPWVYMAAMFAGIVLMFKVFSGDFKGESGHLADNKTLQTIHQDFFEDENYEDVYDYFEYQAIKCNYREEVFIDDAN